MRKDKTYEYIDDLDTYKNENTTDLGFEDDFADNPDMGVYIPVKDYNTSESKDLYTRDDWEKKRDRLLINLRHELNLCDIDNEKDEEAYLEYWKNPNSLNKEQFIPWLPEGESIGKDNTYGGRRIRKICEYTKTVSKDKPFHFVLNTELRKEIRKNYSYVSTKEDEKTVIFRVYNLDEDGNRQKPPYRFKFVESLQSKIDADSKVAFNEEEKKFFFSDGSEHLFNEEEDYLTIEKVIEETDYKVDDKGEKTKAYDTIRDLTKPNKGIEGYELELMFGYMSLMGRDPDMGRRKVNGEYKYYRLTKDVYDKNGRMITSDKKWVNRKLRKPIKDNQGNVIKQIPFQLSELKGALQQCINIYEGENKKERFLNLIDVMKKERAEAEARAEAKNKVKEENAAEESTVNE